MKRFFLSSLVILLAGFSLSSASYAKQTNLNDPVADLNEDGTITLEELEEYNRDQRNKK